MKSNFLFLLSVGFAILVFAFPSCAKKDLNEILLQRNGQWNIDELQHKETVGGVLDVDTIVADFGRVTFQEGGVCEVIFGNSSFGMDTNLYTWTEDEATLTMIPTTVVEPPIIWTVEESRTKTQHWSNVRNDSINNLPRLTEDNLKLRRMN